MSNLTRTMLSSIDYQYIADKRKKNFEALHKKLSKYNLFKLEEPEDPLYLYPFLPSENIKRALIDRKNICTGNLERVGMSRFLWNH